MFASELIEVAVIAKRYYLDGRTKTEIANELGISRFKVARTLEFALAEGIVRIEISMPPGIDVELSESLRLRFGLHHAVVVVPPNDVESTVREQLGKAAADLLSAIVTSDDVLGISWGRTLDVMITSLSRLAPCPIVQLTGVTGSPSDSALELVRRAAAISGGSAYPIVAPLVASDPTVARLFCREPHISSAMRMFPKITKATIAIGSWQPPDSQLRSALSRQDQEMLARAGVCAEFCGVLLDSEGRQVCQEFSSRIVGASLADLRRIPEVLAVAGGKRKQRAIQAVLRANFVTSLVTDVGTARSLLGAQT